MNSGTLDRLLAFDLEKKRLMPGLLAGIDEAGRGPLAGPVVAAAVIFFRKPELPNLNDSKQVTALKRRNLYTEILKMALTGIGVADQSEIDVLNIYQATRLAMKRAVLALSVSPDFLLIDGNMKLDLPLKQLAVVKGDTKSASIAAASIIAKVYRDALMLRFDELYPGYDFKKHKGYPTPDHIKKMNALGPSPIHRTSFAPVRRCLENLPF